MRIGTHIYALSSKIIVFISMLRALLFVVVVALFVAFQGQWLA